MKTIGKALAAAGVATAIVLGGCISANANDTSTVDYGEFDAVTFGHTLSQVQSVFDSTGVVYMQSSTYLAKNYRSESNPRGTSVYVDYMKQNGVWKLAKKSASWGYWPQPGQNPATKSEYLSIKAGMTLAKVRSLIGSTGRRAGDAVNKYGTLRNYVWPAATSTDGVVIVEFRKQNGIYSVLRKSALWE